MINKFCLLKYIRKENGFVDIKIINYILIYFNKFIVFYIVRYMIYRESFWVVGKIVESFILFIEFVLYIWFIYYIDLGSYFI